MPIAASRTTLAVAFPSPAEADPHHRRVFHDVPIHHSVGFCKNPHAAPVVVIARLKIANEIAGADSKPAAIVEIGNRNAGCCIVDDVVGNEGAFKREFGVKRDFPKPCTIVPHDMHG